MASVPRLDLPRSVRLVPIEGQPPDLARLDDACSYRPRCRFAIRALRAELPAARDDERGPSRRLLSQARAARALVTGAAEDFTARSLCLIAAPPVVG